ncbi:hypothetical protein Y032_0168g186 [Ancylostoma ceylanicum]|uniref:Receptor expression-enhancing protein n=1 Tax=Ancylostoma ceylanicum TaxID=53326 RepID=A0A016SVH7_9BILA|nr:hypothetical protein Y032_0168g186 [Ancylostoma ceylanicum]
MDQFIESVQDKVHNKKWWTARWLEDLSKKTEVDVDTLSKSIAGVVFVICACTKQARLLCNSILIAVPLIFTFGYPQEAAPKDDMVIYWGCFGVLTICDTGFQKFPLYYDIKLLLAMMMFVDPPKLIDKIKELINGEQTTQESRIFNKNEMDTLRKQEQHSPRPEKPGDVGSSKRGVDSGKRMKREAQEPDDKTQRKGNNNVSDRPTESCSMKPTQLCFSTELQLSMFNRREFVK